MKKLLLLALLSASTLAIAADAPSADGFIPLFNGKDLNDWKASEDSGTFSVVDGNMQVNGKRSHLFYEGPVHNHDFKNFHLRVECMTFEHANSGVYFHTAYQEKGFPDKGFEVQVNTTHGDPKKTGGLYDIKDTFTAKEKVGEWFTMDIIVEGKHVVTKVNGEVVTDWTQEGDGPANPKHPQRVIDHGTFAIQGHDPGSKVLFRKIEVKPLD